MINISAPTPCTNLSTRREGSNDNSDKYFWFADRLSALKGKTEMFRGIRCGILILLFCCTICKETLPVQELSRTTSSGSSNSDFSG